MSASGNPWERPWTMDEMISNAENWTLAGDVALLETLKSYAENLINKSTQINDTITELTNNLSQVDVKLSLAQNEFHSLKNRQFIESRVYDEDETATLPDVKSEPPKTTAENTDHTEDIRNAALRGLSVFNKYYDKVEVAVSESDDEDDVNLPNYVLCPKDPYINRPLPYVIGSDEWNKTWHVGLIDSSSDESDPDKDSYEVSETDSESEFEAQRPQNVSQIKSTSDTSSELDFTRPPKTDLFASSDSENSTHSSLKNNNNNTRNFAEQLSAKLGNVINQDKVEEEEEKEEINRRPIKPKTSTDFSDNLFFDEPPPLDNIASKGLFSGGSLFDDDDNDEFLTPSGSRSLDVEKEKESLNKKTSADLFNEESSDEDIFSGKTSILPPSNVISKPPLFADEPPALDAKKKPIGGVSIFGGADILNKKLLRRQEESSSDEDEAEKTPKVEIKVKEEPAPSKKKIDLFDDNDDNESTDDLFNTNYQKQNRPKIDLFKDQDEIVKEETNNLTENKAENVVDNITKNDEKQKISLFDDGDDLFKDDLFSHSTTKFTSSLFDEDDNTQTNDDLFASPSNNEPPDNKSSINIDTKSEAKDIFDKTSDSLLDKKTMEAKMSLFDSPPPEQDDLFADTEDIIKTIESKSLQRSDDLFATIDDKSELFATTNEISDLFKTTSNENIAQTVDTVSNRKILAVQSELTNENLDNNSFGDDLFNTPNESIIDDDFSFKSPNEDRMDILPDVDLFKPTNSGAAVSFFDSTPPPIDQQWESKSDTMSLDDEPEPDENATNQKSVSLFDDEPPLFEPKSVSNMTQKFENVTEDVIAKPKTSPGKLKHNLNINVGALIPGFIPPKKREVEKSVSFEGVDDDNNPFDTTDNVEVLHSVTKDRVRVPFQRRPSTRRGRKAALKQASDSDFKLDKDENISKDKEETQEIKHEAIVSHEMESNDLFNKSPIENKTNDADDKKAPESPSSSLFSENKKIPKIPKKDLFDDSDDDDLFSSKKSSQVVTASKKPKKSLFDDEDDDDIFKSFSTGNSAKKPETKIAMEKKLPKTSIKKLENTKPDDDPLSALLK